MQNESGPVKGEESETVSAPKPPRNWRAVSPALMTTMQELLNGAVALQAQLGPVDAQALIVELQALTMSLQDPKPNSDAWQVGVQRRSAAIWDLLTQAGLAGITNLKEKP